MRKKILSLFGMLLLLSYAAEVRAQGKPKHGRVCGDPTAACKNRENFSPSDLPFDTGKNMVIADSEFFYAIVLKSAKLGDYSGCAKAFPESERLSIQELFPHNMVFASRCSEPGENSYSGMAQGTGFLAVYAGRTLAEANAFLKKVQATGQFPGVRVRRTRASMNGT